MADDDIFNPYLPVPPPNNRPDKTEPAAGPENATPKETAPTDDGIFNPYLPVPPPKNRPDKKEPAAGQPNKARQTKATPQEKAIGQQDAQATTAPADTPPAVNHQMELALKMAGDSMGLVTQALSAVNKGMELGDSLAIRALQAIPALPGMASLPVATHFSPVLGIDVHFVRLPPNPMMPLPHPYVGMVFDPSDFISATLISLAAKVVPPAPDEESGEGKLANRAFAGLTLAISMLGATVLVNGLPRAVTGVKSKNLHFPLGAGFSLPTPLKNKGHVQFGSLTVAADGDPLTGMMHLSNDCWDIGLMALLRGKRPN